MKTTEELPIFAPHRISEQQFKLILQRYRSPALEEVDELLAVCDEYGIDRAVALAFFVKESSCGTAGVAARTKNWGNLRRGKRQIASTDHPFAVYERWVDGLRDFCELLKRYKAKGKTTVEQVVPLYAPASDGNRPDSYITTTRRLVRRWQQEDKPPLPARMRVTARIGLRIRAAPTVSATIIGALPFGAEVTLVEKREGWYRLEQGGWVFGGWIEPAI